MNTRTHHLDLFYEANSLTNTLMNRLDELRKSLHVTKWECDPQHTKLSRITDHAYARLQRRYQKYQTT